MSTAKKAELELLLKIEQLQVVQNDAVRTLSETDQRTTSFVVKMQVEEEGEELEGESGGRQCPYNQHAYEDNITSNC
jgi:hypothetical protein